MSATIPQFKRETEVTNSIVTKARTLLTIPPNFFAITTGLAGLASVWQLAGELYHFPGWIGDVLYVVATAVYLLLLITFAMKLILTPKVVINELTHPMLGPFYALLPISGMLLAAGLQHPAPQFALILFLVFFSAMFLLGGWMTGQWIVARLDLDAFHPGYFLPTVAGSLVGANEAAHFHLTGLGWMSFGIGVICWVVLGSIILNRLFFRASLPEKLVPTLAIEIAPPAVAGLAYFALTNGRIDTVAYILAGYAALMALVQVRLIPIYLKTPFTPGFWSFTFSYIAFVLDAMLWINAEHLAGGIVLGVVLLTAITLLIGGIVVRSLIELRQGTFLPVS